MTPTSSKSGFTLLEVLVALAILSVTLGAVYQIFSSSLADQTEAAREAQAVSVGQSILARIGVDMPVKLGESSGDAGDGFVWSLSMVAGDAPATALVRPVQVAVIVEWRRGPAARSITLHSTRLVPRAVSP